MAVIFYDGFDGFTNAAQANRRGIYPVSLDVKTTGGRFGGGAIQGYNNTYGISVPLTSISGDTLFIAFAFNQTNSTGDLGFSLARGQASRVTGSGNYTVFYMRQISGSTVTVYNASGTSIGAFNMPLDGAWHWWDIKVVALAGTNGSLQIRMDGNVVFSVTGVNMAGGYATGNSWCWAFGYGYGYQGSNNGYFDDLVVCDTSGTANNNLIPDCRIDTKYADSVDTAGAWTANTGTLNSATATQDDDTSYISSSTALDEFFLGVGDLSVTPSSIFAVQATSIVKKTGAEGTTFTPEIKSGATVGAGSAMGLSTSYNGAKKIFEVDPATLAAWTASAVNALKVGGKLS